MWISDVPYHAAYTKIVSQLIQGLQIRVKTTKFLEENMIENIYIFGLDGGFFDGTWKHEQREKEYIHWTSSTTGALFPFNVSKNTSRKWKNNL